MAKDTKLYDLVDVKDPKVVLAEIKHIIALMTEEFDFSDLEMIFSDTTCLFKGEYPGYRASNTKYHDLEHTQSVVLATARLVHGCFTEGMVFKKNHLLLGITAALFHDVGLIQTADDKVGSGAKYTVGHEQRSIEFMRDYLSEKRFREQEIEDCAHLIMCTNLYLALREIPFRSPEMEILGKIVGSADLVAQIADRHYLEKLLLLFQEFKEADIPDFVTELDLLKKTEGFYKNITQKRLEDEFGGIYTCMLSHFKNRWDLQKDLYAESIQRNIEYLRSILSKVDDSASFIQKNLRRGGIIDILSK